MTKLNTVYLYFITGLLCIVLGITTIDSGNVTAGWIWVDIGAMHQIIAAINLYSWYHNREQS